MKKYIDIETSEILTMEDLEKEYKDLFENGETETNGFAAYLENCLSKNGTLIEIIEE